MLIISIIHIEKFNDRPKIALFLLIIIEMLVVALYYYIFPNHFFSLFYSLCAHIKFNSYTPIIEFIKSSTPIFFCISNEIYFSTKMPSLQWWPSFSSLTFTSQFYNIFFSFVFVVLLNLLLLLVYIRRGWNNVRLSHSSLTFLCYPYFLCA